MFIHTFTKDLFNPYGGKFGVVNIWERSSNIIPLLKKFPVYGNMCMKEQRQRMQWVDVNINAKGILPLHLEFRVSEDWSICTIFDKLTFVYAKHQFPHLQNEDVCLMLYISQPILVKVQWRKRSFSTRHYKYIENIYILWNIYTFINPYNWISQSVPCTQLKSPGKGQYISKDSSKIYTLSIRVFSIKQ